MTSDGPDEPYELITPTGGVSYALREQIPEAAAWAIIDFINGRLLANPRRLGAPLHGRLEGLYGAHVGDYRVIYDVDEEQRTVEITRVARRADIYGIG